LSEAPEVQIAILKTEVDYLKKNIDEMRTDVRDIKEVLSQARGGWKTLMLVAGISSTIGALTVKLVPWIGALPK
jgi:hypothetical protein